MVRGSVQAILLVLLKVLCRDCNRYPEKLTSTLFRSRVLFLHRGSREANFLGMADLSRDSLFKVPAQVVIEKCGAAPHDEWIFLHDPWQCKCSLGHEDSAYSGHYLYDISCDVSS